MNLGSQAFKELQRLGTKMLLQVLHQKLLPLIENLSQNAIFLATTLKAVKKSQK